jgi:hypothetical protein
MTINAQCPNCGGQLAAPERAAGKILKCPQCLTPIQVPSLDEPVSTFLPDQRKKCPFCAELIAAEAIKCRFCGSMLVPFPQPDLPARASQESQRIHPSDPPKSPVLMGLLSGCCIAGLGQMVLGQVLKGAMCLIGVMLLAVVTHGVSALVTWPLLGVDAYLVAKKLKSGKTVTPWECFPMG